MLKSTGAFAVGLRGGRRPRDAAMAVVLGLLVGATCGWNFSFGLLLVMAMCLNLPTRLFAAASLAGWALACLAGELTRSAGVALLDQFRLGSAVAALGDGPFVALLGWDSYPLVGGVAMALAIGLPLAAFAAGAVAHRNRKSDEVDSPLIRRRALPLALATAAALVAAPWWIGPRMASRELLRQFSQYNTAEVTAAETQLSLWNGKFVMRDLRIADPAHLDRDRLRIGRVVGQLSPGELLRGRLHVETVSLEHVRADVARRELARGADDPPEAVEPGSLNFADSGDERRIDLGAYLADWPVVRRDLAWLEWLVSGVEGLASAESADASTAWENAAARSELGARRPRVSIRRLVASDLASAWRLGRKSLLELSELTSDPRSTKQQTSLRLVVPQFAGELHVQFQLRGETLRHTVKCSAYELSLAQLTSASPDSAAESAAAVTGEGWLNRSRLELPLQIEMQPQDLPMEGPGKFAGIDHGQWRQIVSRLHRLRIEALLGGPWAAPKLTIDASRLLDQVKHQLRASGAHEFAKAMDDQLTRPREQTEIVQTSASESEPGSPGVCELTDEEFSPRDSRAQAPSVTVAHRRSLGGDDQPPVYPNTSTPYAQTEGDASLIAHEASQGELPPVEPIATQATPRYGSDTRTATRPGPVNLFVGSDPIELAPPPATDATPVGIDRSPPATSPAWSNDAPEERDTAFADRPRTVVRHSFLARWSDMLRDRFHRSSRVPEPEPIDDLTPPAMPPPYYSTPAFDAPPLEPSSDEPGMPSTAASQPWYKRVWR